MKFWGLAALICGCGLGVWAADPVVPAQPAAPEDGPARIAVDVTRVNVLFTVTDKKGRFITDLNKDDF
ncbi:MAG: hypothetical protein JO323_14915, partial [Acidobacteriia bacterium]|nr:hypothetical protein [Terriglobia bacterium]